MSDVDQSVLVGNEDDRLAFLGECDVILSLWILTAVMACENSSIILFPSLLLASEAKCCFQLVERGMVTFLVSTVKEPTDEKGGCFNR